MNSPVSADEKQLKCERTLSLENERNFIHDLFLIIKNELFKCVTTDQSLHLYLYPTIVITIFTENRKTYPNFGKIERNIKQRNLE